LLGDEHPNTQSIVQNLVQVKAALR